jgi:hypothetical protein
MLEPRILDSRVTQVMDATRRRALSAAIRDERLARRPGQLSTGCRLLVRVGDLLIAAGSGLRARYAPPVQRAPEVCCAEC